MGGVTDFLFGAPSKQKSSNNSSGSSTSGNQSYDVLNNALAPTLGYGAQAGNMIGSLLGLPSSSPVTPNPAPSSGPAPIYNPTPTPTYGGGGSYNPYQPGYGGGGFSSYGGFDGENRLAARFNLDEPIDGQSGQGAMGYPGPVGRETPINLLNENQPSTQSVSGQGSALENFSNSAGMDFLRNQGVKAIEASQAGKGMLQSGATGQALTSFGNNLAKTYLNDYLTHLNDYASIGTKNAAILSGAGANSYSTSNSSGTGTSNGGKAGLLPSILGGAASNPSLPGVIAAFA